MIYCAVPRFLDPALLRVLLPALDDMERQKRWDYYRRLTFVSATGEERVVFHPIVRALLLQLLSPGSGPMMRLCWPSGITGRGMASKRLCSIPG